MRHGPDGFRFSASDLSDFAECQHLAWLEGQAARGQRVPDGVARDPMADLLARRGRAHEQAWLARLEREGRAIARIAYDPADPAPAVAATREAMRQGAPAIYQAVLQDGAWFGIADFLLRLDSPSALGPWSYEVADAKLARRTKPHYLLQLSLYSELVARVQRRRPASMHVLLGGERPPDSHACRDYGAYFRAFRRRFEATVVAPAEPAYPLEVEHCGVCRWSSACARRREADDHLCRVANITRLQMARLEAAGVNTMAALAALPAGSVAPHVAAPTLDRLRAQARLQSAERADGRHRFEFLPPVEGRGFALLPAPSPGDVFFDMEGDPYYDANGLEYLFGAHWLEPDGTPAYRAFWAHSRGEEKAAFEQFMDFIVARRARDPAMHVYHYANYEAAALKRLASRHATREAELDDLLRGRVLADLFLVVAQGLRVSFPSYSIKDIEHFYRAARQGAVTTAGGSIVEYELWIEARDPRKLEDIRSYNEDDCVSTRQLRDWLLARRGEAYAQFGQPVPPPPVPPVSAPSPARQAEDAECEALVARLTRGIAADPAALSGADRARWVLAQLVHYHRRELRPQWWMHFARLLMTEEELLSDAESIAQIEPDPSAPPRPSARSLVHTLRFPPQDTKLRAGAQVLDAANGSFAGEIVAVDPRRGRLVLKRGPKYAGAAIPRALVPGAPLDAPAQRAAVRRVAGEAADSGRYRALRDVLMRDPPRVLGLARGAPLQNGHVDVELAWDVVSRLDRSYLFVQGPPGSGKTWLGAQLIVRLLRAGKTVGVTAHSHRAILNLLEGIEAFAGAGGVAFRGIKKCAGSGGDDDETAFRTRLPEPWIRNVTDNPDGVPPGVRLLAGTAWLFARAEFDDALDYLFVDEAGQVALGDAIAVGTAARNLVLLGDPNQLPQVSQGAHPEGAGASVLEHLLGDETTIPRERGLFLDRTWRMHPDVCRFISELAYAERLVSGEGRERQRIDAPGALTGTGVRYLAVEHTGNEQRSDEEVARVVESVGALLDGGAFTDHAGVTRRLTLDDILVVSPYNMQVSALENALPPGTRVGTVDKFQGREAAIVFYSMATSSGEDLPRDIAFLFSRHRLNVAISRARALAVLVASPRLLQASCGTAEEMRLVNGVCRFVEFADPALAEPAEGAEEPR